MAVLRTSGFGGLSGDVVLRIALFVVRCLPRPPVALATVVYDPRDDGDAGQQAYADFPSRSRALSQAQRLALRQWRDTAAHVVDGVRRLRAVSLFFRASVPYLDFVHEYAAGFRLSRSVAETRLLVVLGSDAGAAYSAPEVPLDVPAVRLLEVYDTSVAVARFTRLARLAADWTDMSPARRKWQASLALVTALESDRPWWRLCSLALDAPQDDTAHTSRTFRTVAAALRMAVLSRVLLIRGPAVVSRETAPDDDACSTCSLSSCTLM